MPRRVMPRPGVCRAFLPKGFGITEVPHKIHEGKLKATTFGEDPLQTDPDLGMLREAFSKLDLIIVRDIFMTKTAMMADVIFPATSWGEHENVFSSADRGFQRCYKAVDAKGDVKDDWEIHSLMATAMGYPMKYNNAPGNLGRTAQPVPSVYRRDLREMADLGYVQWLRNRGSPRHAVALQRQQVRHPERQGTAVRH